jgi:hypothetical protein
MSKIFKTQVKNRGLEVITRSELFGSSWEIGFFGDESSVALKNKIIPDQIIKLWDESIDGDGSDVRKVHAVVVKLLGRGKSLKEVYDKIILLAHQVSVDKKNVDDLLGPVFKS